MSDAELRTTQVDLGGLMLVLGEHLYSTPAVALRELIQNAHDAIVRRRMESTAGDERIEIDVVGSDLFVRDTGAGLTREEVIAFLATVGAGYTRTLRQASASEELIGFFGLGFLSAFVVAEEVAVTTTSYQTPDEAWIYRSSNGERYSLAEAPARPVGSEVRLRLKPRFDDLRRQDVVVALARRYCALLPVGVFVGNEVVNQEPPPWKVADADPVRALRRRLEFARRFETTFEPICVFDVDDPDDDVRGLLWIQDGATWATSDNRHLSVFVRGMLLDDDNKELLPAWAGFVGGVIESARLTPVASREDLQRDAAWNRVQARLRAALVTGLAELPRHSPEAWRRVRSRHGEALLGAAIADPRLFTALADELRVPTSEGDLPVSRLRQAGRGRVHVSLATHGGFEEMIFRALKQPVAVGTRYGVLPFLRRWAEVNGGTVVELGTEAGNRQIFRVADLPDADLDRLTRCFGGEDRRIVPARFAPDDLPLVLLPDRDAELKRRIEADEADKRIATAALGLARLFTAGLAQNAPLTLYVNLDNRAIAAVLRAAAEPDHDAVVLLRGVAALLAGSGEDRPAIDLGPNLRDLGRLACRLLEG